ncbi:MAG: HDIG domain-containing protein [Actinomycetota bacterium]|nr:HDIG domain-containing protein [Actinomycetota bacterium]
MDDKEGLKQKRFRWRSLGPRSGEGKALFISLVLLLILLLMLVLEYVPRGASFEEGKPSPETVISSREFSVVDEDRTEEAREDERQRIKDLFLDPNAHTAAVSEMGEFINQARMLAGEEGSLDDKIAQLKQSGGSEIKRSTLKNLLESQEGQSREIYAAAVDLLNSAMYNPVSSDNIEELRDAILDQAGELGLDEQVSEAAGELAAEFLTVNTTYSASTIDHDMEAAASAVPPVYVTVEVGQKIVEKGDLITPLTLSILEEAGALSPAGTYQQVIAISLLLLALYASAVFFFWRFKPELAGNWRVVAMICLVFLVFCLLCRLFSVLADENLLWGYLIPLALLGMTLSVLLDHMIALFMVFIGGVMTGMVVKGNFYLTITVLLGGLLGVLLIKRIKSREKLVRAGTELSLTIAAVSMITAGIFKDIQFILAAGALGFGNGVLSTLLTLGSMPVLERISNITTPMHLLELASPDHPLMKELITKAPGTYSHSVIVGNMADAATRDIGADALLARVGSYYHDIGKIKRSTFFVENQPEGYNGHEKLKPNLSALVITAHVKEGVDMAREYHLPEEIIDIIQQHHGTSLIRYFYARALEEGGETGSISESRFRYPGKKPQSKEAAVVMLADAIEAAAKAMVKPTPVKLEQLTRNLIKERLDDGQLSDSNLTLGDLDKIARAFSRILSGMYHGRVEYPALVKEERPS